VSAVSITEAANFIKLTTTLVQRTHQRQTLTTKMANTRSSAKTPEVPPSESKKEEEPAVVVVEEEEDEAAKSTIEQKLRLKKPLPSVNHLLVFGDEEGSPESFRDTARFFAFMFLTFVLSLVAWHFLFLEGSKGGQKKNWSNRGTHDEM